jgi:hypothetical protein
VLLPDDPLEELEQRDPLPLGGIRVPLGQAGLEIPVEVAERDRVARLVALRTKVPKQVPQVHGLAGVVRRGREGFQGRGVGVDQFPRGGRGRWGFGRPCGLDGFGEGAAADDEVARIDALGDVKLAGVEAVKGEFDQVQGGAGGRLVLRLEGFLVLPTAEPEPGAVDVALLAEVGHVRVASLDGTRGGWDRGGSSDPGLPHGATRLTQEALMRHRPTIMAGAARSRIAASV